MLLNLTLAIEERLLVTRLPQAVEKYPLKIDKIPILQTEGLLVGFRSSILFAHHWNSILFCYIFTGTSPPLSEPLLTQRTAASPSSIGFSVGKNESLLFPLAHKGMRREHRGMLWARTSLGTLPAGPEDAKWS